MLFLKIIFFTNYVRSLNFPEKLKPLEEKKISDPWAFCFLSVNQFYKMKATVCLPPCRSADLRVYPPYCLHAYLLHCLRVYLPTCLPIPTYVPTGLPACLRATCLLPYLPTCLRATCVLAYLPDSCPSLCFCASVRV
jgi:hypothetical protein